MICVKAAGTGIVRSYELGVSAYVVKPLDFQHFVESVKGLGCFCALINQPPQASR